MESDLSLEFLRVTEQAAVACAHTMGQGDRHGSDQVAVEAMRSEMDTVPIDGTIVIGEGERDEAPMLYIGEKVGMAHHGKANGRHLRRRSTSRSIRSRARTCARPARRMRSRCWPRPKSGGLLHAPDVYMEKLVVGPTSKHLVDLDAPVRENLRAIARSLGRQVDELTVVVLDRPRHEKLIAEIRATGARIRLIGDGDLSAGIAAAVSGTRRARGDGHRRRARRRADGGRHALSQRRDLRAPGRRQAGATKNAAAAMGIKDFKKIYKSSDLACGKDIVFAATGVTDGSLMKGVQFFGAGIRTSSLVMQTNPHRIRFIDSIQVYPGPSVKIRF